MKRYLGYSAVCLFILIFLSVNGLHANKRRILGGGPVMTLASSYLTIDSGSVKVEDGSSWSYATGLYWFFDYMINPYVSFRSNWMFYPGYINADLAEAREEIGVIKLHEMGFSLLRHFDGGSVEPWFGAGPHLQFATINDVNSYVVHILISLGFDWEFSESTYLCPELQFGIGARIIKSEEESVVVDLPTGDDFSTSGIVILFKVGAGKSF